MTLEEQIDTQIGEVRTDSLDLSFGEIANMRKSEELNYPTRIPATLPMVDRTEIASD